MLTSRQKEIIIRLLYEDDWWGIEDLQVYFPLTKRTIRNDLMTIEEWLLNKNAVLKRHRKKGVRLELNQVSRKELIEAVEGAVDYVSSHDRIPDMLFRLLLNDSITVDRLTKQYAISEKTLETDIIELRRQLLNSSLTLNRKNRKLFITGDEREKRRKLSAHLKDNMSGGEFLQVLYSEENDVYSSIKDWVNPSEIKFLTEVMATISKELSIQFSDDAYTALVIHFYMMTERMNHANHIDIPDEKLKSLKASAEFNKVKSIMANTIEARYNIHLPDEELAYITQHLLGAQKDKESVTESSRAYQLSSEIVSRVQRHLQHPLSESERIVKQLAVHMESAIYRAEHGLNSNNPMLSQIKQEMYELFNIVKKELENLTETTPLRFDEGEAGYITIHIGTGLSKSVFRARKRVAIVCSSGIGTATMLENRLKREFANIIISGKFSVKEVMESPAEAGDLYISTVPLPEEVQNEWVLVSPFLNPADLSKLEEILGKVSASESLEYEKIKMVRQLIQLTEESAEIHDYRKLSSDLLRWLQGSYINENDSKILSRILPPESIKLSAGEEHWAGVIRSANRLLMKRGITKEDYAEQLIKMIENKDHHFMIQEGVIFPHVKMDDAVNGTGISLIALDNSMTFGNKEGTAWLCILLGSDTNTGYENALGTLMDLLNDSTFLKKVKESRDPWDIHAYIREKEGVRS